MSEECLGSIGKDCSDNAVVVITNVKNLKKEHLTNIIEQAEKLEGKDGFKFDQLIRYSEGGDEYIIGLALTLPRNGKIYAEMITDIEGKQRVGEIRIRCYDKNDDNIWDDDIPF